jgi:hypothetical protein
MFKPMLRFLCLLLIVNSTFMFAQSAKASPSKVRQSNPSSFMISKAEFEELLGMKVAERVNTRENKYLNGSVLLMNSLNGDIRFLKIKLSFFRNAYLLVQVNGEYSTQVFVMSEDKSVFYKGRMDNGNVMMQKCNEDDIVSE